MIILTFFGDYKGKIEHFNHAVEDSRPINITLIFLSICSILVGVIFYDIFLGKNAEYFFSQSLFISTDNTVFYDLHYIPKWAKITPIFGHDSWAIFSFIFLCNETKITPNFF